MGITFSTLATNQLQAVQMSFFFFLPSRLLSGFMFPFRGMPGWAQAIGEVLPITHFLHIVRGVLLKGSTFMDQTSANDLKIDKSSSKFNSLKHYAKGVSANSPGLPAASLGESQATLG